MALAAIVHVARVSKNQGRLCSTCTWKDVQCLDSISQNGLLHGLLKNLFLSLSQQSLKQEKYLGDVHIGHRAALDGTALCPTRLRHCTTLL
jgi:hypothetical protein